MAKATRYTPELIAEYKKQGYWDDTTLSDLWQRNAALYPDAEAIADSRHRLTWSQANEWIDKLAIGLMERGIKKDDMIVSQLPNCIELYLLRVACERASILFLPAMLNLRRNEMEYMLGRNAVKAIIITWESRKINYFEMVQDMRPHLPQLEHIFAVGERVPPGAISLDEILGLPLEGRYPPGYPVKTTCPPTEIFLLLHTTGSTGVPKLVEYPFCCRMVTNRDQINFFDLSHNDTTAILGPALAGPNNVPNFTAPEVGARIVILDHFTADGALRLIEKEKVSVISAVPAQLAMMLEQSQLRKYDLSSVRCWYSVGAPLPHKVGAEIEEKIGGKVIIGYGLTDCGGSTFTPPELPREVRLGGPGKVSWGTEVKLVDDWGKDVPQGGTGEVWARGAACSSGYYNDPEATWQAWTKDGWFKTGDLGRFDEQGYLAIVGRKKDMIIRGGSNIYPVEVENLLATHPKILQVAIVKMADAIMGEKACACVVPRPGMDFTFEEMISFLKAKEIALYKLPERLEILDALPMTGGDQKVDKKALERYVAERLIDSAGHDPGGMTNVQQ